MTTTQKQWFDSVKGTLSQNEVARRIGKNTSNFSTALRNSTLHAEDIIAISYELNTDPVRALIETGFLRDYRTAELSPEQIASRVKEDIGKLQRMAIEQDEHVAEVVEFPVQPDPYSDDMPEGAAAYGGDLFDTDDDNDY